MVRVKSISDDGIYYLVNGWYKYKKIFDRNPTYKTEFKTVSSAKRSITMLLKCMGDEYKNDEFIIEEI